jgi:hypothetical protein
MTTTTRTMSGITKGPRVRIAGGTVPLYTEAPTGPEPIEDAPSTTQYVDVVNPRAAIVDEIVEYLKALYK